MSQLVVPLTGAKLRQKPLLAPYPFGVHPEGVQVHGTRGKSFSETVATCLAKQPPYPFGVQGEKASQGKVVRKSWYGKAGLRSTKAPFVPFSLVRVRKPVPYYTPSSHMYQHSQLVPASLGKLGQYPFLHLTPKGYRCTVKRCWDQLVRWNRGTKAYQPGQMVRVQEAVKSYRPELRSCTVDTPIAEV
jgi:hypothetical protein